MPPKSQKSRVKAKGKPVAKKLAPIEELPDTVLTYHIFPFLFTSDQLTLWKHRIEPEIQVYNQRTALLLSCKQWNETITQHRKQVRLSFSTPIGDNPEANGLCVTFDLRHKSQSVSFSMLRTLAQQWYQNKGVIEYPMFLREIVLSNWYYTKDIPFDISKNNTLKSLQIVGAVAKVKWIEKNITPLKELESLHFIAEGKLARLKPFKNPNIQKLVISDCENNELVINETIRNMKQLQVLELVQTNHLISFSTNLKELSLFYCNVNADWIYNTVRAIPSLEKLTIMCQESDHLTIASNTLKEVIVGGEKLKHSPILLCPQLETLSIIRSSITDKEVSELPFAEVAIKYLNLSSNILLQAPVILSDTVQIVEISGCLPIVQESIQCSPHIRIKF
jgi:hypothetical protein